MRMLFETSTWWPNTDTVADSIFKLHTVDMSDCADASKRDLVFRAFTNTTPETVGIYAFRDYDDASSATCSGVTLTDLVEANKVLAYAHNVTVPAATATSVDLVNNANYGPDMSDLSVGYTCSSYAGDWDKYYHYTSNIAEATLRNITSILEEYVSEAMALEDFDVFGIEYGREGRKSRRNQILVRYGESAPGAGSQGRFSINVEFHIDLYMIGDPEGVEHDAVRNGNAVWSILGDERRTLNDFCNIGVEILGMSEPQVLTQEGAGIAGQMVEISGVARYKDVHFMDIN